MKRTVTHNNDYTIIAHTSRLLWNLVQFRKMQNVKGKKKFCKTKMKTKLCRELIVRRRWRRHCPSTRVQFTWILPATMTRIWAAATTATTPTTASRISHERTIFLFVRRSNLDLNIKYSVCVVWSSSGCGCDLQRIFSFINSTKLKTCCEHIFVLSFLAAFFFVRCVLIKYRCDDVLVVALNVWSLLLVALQSTLYTLRSSYCGPTSSSYFTPKYLLFLQPNAIANSTANAHTAAATDVWLCLCGIFPFRRFSLFWFGFALILSLPISFSTFIPFHLIYFPLVRQSHFDSYSRRHTDVRTERKRVCEPSMWFVYRYRWQTMRDTPSADLFSCRFHELNIYAATRCYVLVLRNN